MNARATRPPTPRSLALGLGALAAALFAPAASAQLQVTFRDADLGGTVDVVMSAPIGTTYITIVSLTEGPTYFGPKHPVGYLDVDLALLDLSFLLPNFFATMAAPGSVTEQFDLDPDPTLDGIVANLQMCSLVSGKLTEKSNLCKITFAFPDAWHHSVASLINDPTGVPAIELDDGRIALFGAAGVNIDACEAWEPWRQLSSTLAPLPVGRAAHTVTKLQDGRVLVCGGADINLAALGTGEVYDPLTDTWTATAAMTSVRVAHSARLLSDGRVLVAGGTTDISDALAGATHALKSCELYDPVTNSWSAGPNMARPHVAHMAVTMASGDALIGGGGTYSTIFGIRIPAIDNHAQAFQLPAGSWTAEVTMKAARAGASVVLLADGRALVCGGIGGSITSPSNLTSSETFDPVLAKWTTRGAMSVGRSGMALAVLFGTNRVLVAGGATGTSVTAPVPTDLVELFDPVLNVFTVKAPLPEARAGAAAIVLGSHHAAVFGGVGGVPTAVAIYHD
ncbi:MAG: kelch-like protein [Planctomycetes bacterium]|nr:kelch-like protein [Planctomycetota bacterium]